ncbi:Protein ANTAGONIST OF LIKE HETEROCHROMATIN PROTEIN 1 [Lucilia cuprina]|nr:Protein ANTAGONIST OF LIKE HETEROCHROMATIN PROTEIN 1 [Lucilia cuprina]
MLMDEEEEDEIQEDFTMNMIHFLTHRRSVHLGLPKSSDWRHNVLNKFDDNRFNQMVRLNPEKFAYVLDLIQNDEVFQTICHKSQLRLGSSGDGASVRKVVSLFGIGDGGTIQNVTRRVFKAILKLKNNILYWPGELERSQLVSATKSELPGCVGYIDGCEIKLAEAPTNNHELYFSRKRQYCLKIQAVCDHKLSIRQVTIGYPGSVHDAKIFSNCPIAKHPERYLSHGQWLAGDSAYPIKQYLLTPFRRNSTAHTREARENFNKYFSKYRVRIENCFGLLKEKFGSLKELKFRLLNEKNKKECNNWIMVCCILHNILLRFNSKDVNSQRTGVTLQQTLPTINIRNDLLSFIENHPNI